MERPAKQETGEKGWHLLRVSSVGHSRLHGTRQVTACRSNTEHGTIGLKSKCGSATCTLTAAFLFTLLKLSDNLPALLPLLPMFLR